MAIKAVVTAEEHAALADALKTLYRQEGNVFVLDAEGIDTHPATRSLKTALEGERTGRTEAARQLKELQEKLGTMDPEEAKAALAKIQELDEKARLGEIPEKLKPKFDEAVKLQVESISKNFETQKKGYEKQIADLKGELQGAKGQLESLTIDGAVRDAASKKGLQDWAIEDAILHARNTYKLQEGKPVPMKGDQIIYSGKKPGDPKPIDEWLEDMTASKPGWLKPNGGGGADKARAGQGGQFTLTREQARNPQLYRQTQEQAKKAGQELQVVD
jgi:hypothetical protein